jgi:hypothetical protein
MNIINKVMNILNYALLVLVILNIFKVINDFILLVIGIPIVIYNIIEFFYFRRKKGKS